MTALLLLGHAYMVILVMLCQTLVYREVTALFSIRRVDEGVDNQGKRMKDPWSKTLNWYFFAVTNYFLYGESIIYYFKVFMYCCPYLSRPDLPRTARRILRCAADRLCDKPSVHQLHAIHDWFRRLRHVSQTGLPEAAIRSLLLGTYDPAPYRCFQVGFRIYYLRSVLMIHVVTS